MKLDVSCMRYMTKQVTGGVIRVPIYTYVCLNMYIMALVSRAVNYRLSN